CRPRCQAERLQLSDFLSAVRPNAPEFRALPGTGTTAKCRQLRRAAVSAWTGTTSLPSTHGGKRRGCPLKNQSDAARFGLEKTPVPSSCDQLNSRKFRQVLSELPVAVTGLTNVATRVVTIVDYRRALMSYAHKVPESRM